MSSPINVILTKLAGYQTVTGKVYHAEALKNASAPFIFWIQTQENGEKDLSGYNELLSDSYEFHCVAKNLDSLTEQAAALKTAILSLLGKEESGIRFENITMQMASPTIREAEVNLYRKVYDVIINYTEE